jgi:hypothetical protein
MQESTLGRGIHLGHGSTIGKGSRFGVEKLGLPAPLEHEAIESLPPSNTTEYYRPDPGSAFARIGSPSINTTYDRRDHWPEPYNDAGEEEASSSDAATSEPASR